MASTGLNVVTRRKSSPFRIISHFEEETRQRKFGVSATLKSGFGFRSVYIEISYNGSVEAVKVVL